MTASAVAANRPPRPRHLVAVAGATSTPQPEPYWTPVAIRVAVAADERPLRRLAQLDSAPPLSGTALLAEQGGVLIAAVSLRDGAAIADPFVATVDVVALLRLRAQQLQRRPLSSGACSTSVATSSASA